MADDTTDDASVTTTADGVSAPKRRVGRPRSPRPGDTVTPEGAGPSVRKSRTVKEKVVAAEGAVVEATKTPVAAVANVARSAVKSVKAVKPRAAKRATPPTAKGKTRAAAKPGKSWSTIAIAGGLAAAGAAATAAMFALRSSTPKPAPPEPAPKAHQPDGVDSSASFAAGIADQNTIPDQI